MIPNEFQTERLNAAHARLRASSDLQTTRDLDESDLLIIGRFVQTYNLIEFNLRRSLELFIRAGLLPENDGRKSVHMVTAARLVPLVKSAVSTMERETEDTIALLDEIELRRGFRNMFAHFIARAFEDDFLVFITRDDYDAQQALGRPLRDDGVLFALIDRESVEWLNRHMHEHGLRLARRYIDWRTRFIGPAQTDLPA